MISWAVPLQTCLVTFEDLAGIRHSTEVQAESLYEAAALAIRAFRTSGMLEQMPGPASRFQIEVKTPMVRHEVSVGHVQRWLNQGGTNPMEEAKRKRLRDLLAAK